MKRKFSKVFEAPLVEKGISFSIGQAPGGTGQLLFVYNDKWVACYLLLCLSFPERTVPFLSLVGRPKQDNDER